MKLLLISCLSGVVLLLLWSSFFLKGRRFALRDRLRPADAIVVLAGTRGNLAFLQGKIHTCGGYLPHKLSNENGVSVFGAIGLLKHKVSL